MDNKVLHFLGSRNYVQGATVLEFAFKHLWRDHVFNNPEDVLVVRFKQIAEARSSLAVLRGRQEDPTKPLCANLIIEIDGQKDDYEIVALTEEIAERRSEVFRQKDFLVSSSEEASSSLEGAQDFWELLKEAVQLAKVFHIYKYNKEQKHRFLVGGFEKLRYFIPYQNESFMIRCQIVHHMIRKGRIYNNVRLSFKSNHRETSFILNFIGTKV